MQIVKIRTFYIASRKMYVQGKLKCNACAFGHAVRSRFDVSLESSGAVACSFSRRFVQAEAEDEYSMRLVCLDSVPLLSSLSRDQKAVLADALVNEVHEGELSRAALQTQCRRQL